MERPDWWIGNRSNEEIARAWASEWRASLQREFYDEPVKRPWDAPDPAIWTLMHLVEDDPARALDIVFVVARTTDDEHALRHLGVGPLTELTVADPTLWDAIAIEVRSSSNLLSAVGQVSDTDVPDALWDVYQRSLGR